MEIPLPSNVIPTDSAPTMSRGMYELKKLNARHRAMVNFFLAGLTQREVAERFSMTPAAICIIYNSPLFQEQLLARQAEIDAGADTNLLSTVSEAKEHIEANALMAAEKLVHIAQTADAKTSLQAVNSLLDRCFGTEKKDTPRAPTLNLTIEQVTNLQAVLAESRV